METETKAETYITNRTCDECKSGDMLWKINDFSKIIPYVHKCNNCGCVTNFDKPYPVITHKPIEGTRKEITEGE